MFPSKYLSSCLLAALLLVSSAFAGGSRVPALLQVQHGPIVSGSQSPLAKSIGDPVVLYYWDMTCIPCYVNLEDIIDFSRMVRREGGRFFSIHHGTAQTAATLKKFAGKEKIPYTIARGGKGPGNIRALPKMYVFNKKGDVVYQGPDWKDALSAFKAQLDS